MKNLIVLLSLLLSLSAAAQHKEVLYPKTKEFQQSLTPDSIIVLLKNGNERFLHKMLRGNPVPVYLRNLTF